MPANVHDNDHNIQTRRLARGFQLLCPVGSVILLCVIGFTLNLRSTSAQTTPAFRPKQVLRKPKPPITNPRTVSAQQASQTLHDAELVLGVTVGKEARAYPINMLTGPAREIINDRLGGQDIAATW